MRGRRGGRGRRIGRILLVGVAAACLSVGADAQEAATAQQQVDRIVREGVGYAKLQLEQQSSFPPFAVIEHADGRIERILGPKGAELEALDTSELEGDPARELTLLERRVEREAKAKGDFRVVGIFSDDDVKLPDGRTSKAIQAEMEQVSGTCANVFLPYERVEKTLRYGEEISATGAGLIFHCN